MPPSNDNFASPAGLSLHAVQDIDFAGSTIEAGEPTPSLGAGITGSAWWKLDTTGWSAGTQMIVSLNTFLPDRTHGGGLYDYMDTVVTLYTGTTLTGLTEVQCHAGTGIDPSGGINEWWDNNKYQGHVSFTASPGNVYYVHVGVWSLGKTRVNIDTIKVRKGEKTVLFFGPSLPWGVHNHEVRFVHEVLGFPVEVADRTAWLAKTTADFAAYQAIVIGSRGDDGFTTVQSTANTWGPAVAGNILLGCTNPDHTYNLHWGSTSYRPPTGDAIYDYPGKKFIENAMSYAVASDKGCGLAMYHPGFTAAKLTGLPGGGGASGPNGFVIGNLAPDEAPHIVLPEHRFFQSPHVLSEQQLAGYLTSVDRCFTQFPWGYDYRVLASSPGNTGYYNEDGANGYPYVIAREAPTPAPLLPTGASYVRFCDSFDLSDDLTKRWTRYPTVDRVPRVTSGGVSGKAAFVSASNHHDWGENTGVYVQVPESWKKVIAFTFRYGNPIGGTGADQYIDLLEVGRDPTPGTDSGWAFGYLYLFGNGQISFVNRTQLNETRSTLALVPNTDYRIEIKAQWYLEAGQTPPYPGSVEVRVNGTTWISAPNFQFNVGNWSSQGLTRVAFGGLGHSGFWADLWFSSFIVRDDIVDATNWDFLGPNVAVRGLKPTVSINDTSHPWTGANDARFYHFFDDFYTAHGTMLLDETPDDDLSYARYDPADVPTWTSTTDFGLQIMQGMWNGSNVRAVVSAVYARAESGTPNLDLVWQCGSAGTFPVGTVPLTTAYRYALLVQTTNPKTSAQWVVGDPSTANFYANRGDSINNLSPLFTNPTGAVRVSQLGVEVILDYVRQTPPAPTGPGPNRNQPWIPQFVDSFAAYQEDQIGGSETPSSDYRVPSWEGEPFNQYSATWLRAASFKWSVRNGSVSFQNANPTTGTGGSVKITGWRSSIDQCLLEGPDNRGLYGIAQIGFGFRTNPASQWAAHGVLDPNATIRILTCSILRDTTYWPQAQRMTLDLRRDGHLVVNRAGGNGSGIFNGLNAVSTIPIPDISVRSVIEMRWLSGFGTASTSWTGMAPFVELRIDGQYAGRWEVSGDAGAAPGLGLDLYRLNGQEIGRYKDSTDYVRLGGDWWNTGDIHNLDLWFSDFYTAQINQTYAGWETQEQAVDWLGPDLIVVRQLPSLDVTKAGFTIVGAGTSEANAIGDWKDLITSDLHQTYVAGGPAGAHAAYTYAPANLPAGYTMLGVQASGVAWSMAGVAPPKPEWTDSGGVHNVIDWFAYPQPGYYQQLINYRMERYGEDPTANYFMTTGTWNARAKGLAVVNGSATRLSQLVFESLLYKPAAAGVPQVWVQVVG